MAVTACPYPVFPPARDDLAVASETLRFQAEEAVRRVQTPWGIPAWLITRYDDARAVLREPSLSSDPRHPSYPAFVGQRRASADGSLPRIPLVDMDEPEHSFYRRMIAPKLTVKAVAAVRPDIERVVDRLLDRMAERGGGPVDLVEEFSARLSSEIVCELLAFPVEGREHFRALAEEVRAEATTPQRRVAAQHEMDAYVSATLAGRGAEQPGFFDKVLEARDRGELTDSETVTVGQAMYSAAFSTTASAISLGALALLQHPDQVPLITQDDTDMTRAVEEILRWTSSVHGLARVATEPITVAGQQIAAGDAIIIALPASNHDPRSFDDPDRLDLARVPGDQLGFGQGIHQCPGQHLARAEMQIALSRLFRRFPGLHLSEPAATLRYRRGFVHGLEALPVSW